MPQKVVTVALVTPFDYTTRIGGVEVFVKRFKDALEKNGIEIDVYDERHVDGYTNSFTLMYKLGKLLALQSKKYDIIFCNGGAGMRLWRRHNTVNLYHGNQAGYFLANTQKTWGGTVGFLISYIYELLSGIGRKKVAVSTGVKHDLERYYRFSDIIVTGSTVDVDIFTPVTSKHELRKKYHIPLSANVLFFTGRWEYMKGNDVLLGLMERLQQKNIVFLIAAPHVGEDDRLQLRDYATYIIDDMDNERIHELYQLSDMFIFPSRFEGCSFALLEAMSSGLPFVISKVGNAIDIYEDNKKLRNYILDTFAIDVWEKAISEILDMDTYTDISHEVRMYALQHYALDVFEKKYMSIIEDIMG